MKQKVEFYYHKAIWEIGQKILDEINDGWLVVLIAGAERTWIVVYQIPIEPNVQERQ